MSKERRILRLDLDSIERSLVTVQDNWPSIAAELRRRKIKGKDPFTSVVRAGMMDAYEHFDGLLREDVEPFSNRSISQMCELNNRVHGYGLSAELRQEYQRPIAENSYKFYMNIEPISKWYEKHMTEPHPLKAAAEVYVAIVGHPQLFIEGNHRTGSLIASWISMYYGHPPFVLSADNAIAYFEPSAEIKEFADKATWRGQMTLPKYRKRFKAFWEAHIDSQHVLPDPQPQSSLILPK